MSSAYSENGWNRGMICLDYIILEQEEVASISLFNLYNFNLNVKHLFTIISEQAENFYSLPQIPVTTI